MTTNRWVLGARPRTLPAAVVPVALGAAAAAGELPVAAQLASALQQLQRQRALPPGLTARDRNPAC